MSDVFISSYTFSAILLTSISQPVVEDDGGYPITITGQFLDRTAQVFVERGPVQFRCYGGESGRGFNPYPLPTTLGFVTPPMPRGGAPWDVRVIQGTEQEVLPGVLSVVARNWQSGTFEFRRVFPPWWRTGPRSLTSVELLT